MTREERVGLSIISCFVLAAGLFYGVAIIPGLQDFMRRVTPEIGSATALDTAAEEAPEFAAVPRFGVLSGRLLDSRTHSPLINPVILVRGLDHVARPEIDIRPDGHFRVSGLPVGRSFDLAVRRQGYADYSFRDRFDVSTTKDIGDLYLQRMVLVEGRVTDRLGRGVVGARVSWHAPLPILSPQSARSRPWILSRLLRQTLPPKREVFTDRTGRFSFGDVVPEAFDLVVSCKDFATGLRRGARLDGSASRRFLEVILDRGLPYQGRVLDDQDQPLSGATLVVQSGLSAHLWRRAATDSAGNFQFADLQPGPWTLALLHDQAGAQDLGDIQVPSASTLFRVPRVEERIRFDERTAREDWSLDLLPRDPARGLARFGLDFREPEFHATLDKFGLAWRKGGAPPIFRAPSLERENRLSPPDVTEGEGLVLEVRDDQTQRALSQVSIYLNRRQDETIPYKTGLGDALTVTDNDGHAGVKTYRGESHGLLFIRDGYHPYTVWQPTSPMQVSMRPLKTFEVRVQGTDQRGVPHCRVIAVPQKGSDEIELRRRLIPRALEAETDESGVAHLTEWDDMRSWSLVIDDRRGFGRLDLLMTEGDEDRVLTLTRGAWVEGSVRDSRGRAIEGAVVSVELPQEAAIAPDDLEARKRVYALTDRFGEYRLGPLPADQALTMIGIHGDQRVEKALPALSEGYRLLAFELELP